MTAVDRTIWDPGQSDLRLLRRPLAFLHAEHLRHRELCRAAEDLAETQPFDRVLAEAVKTFIEREIGLHVIDEEEDLFPLLRRRLEPSDDAEKVIGLLSGEHAADEVLAEEIVGGLVAALDSDATELPRRLRNALVTFADRQRRHLTVENAIVLPLAAKRLSGRDLDEMARRMAARRGIDLAGTAA